MRKRFQKGCVTEVDGKWIGQWREDGHRRKKTLGVASKKKMTKSQAEAELAKILAPINAREQNSTGEMTLDSFISDVYLPLYRRKWKASTVGVNENRLKVHIQTAFGARKLVGTRREELQDYLHGKADSGLSHSVVAHLRWDLNQIFNLAKAEGCLRTNPAEALYIPRNAPHPVREIMTLEEVQKCLKVLDRRESLIVRLAVIAGMRPGEIFALRCGQLRAVSVKVQERIYRGKSDTPKTRQSVRDAALSGDLMADMRSWVADLPNQSEMAWIFPSENLRTPLAKDNIWRRSIKPKLEAVGIGWVNFQVFRRTSSSLLNDLGIEAKLVADQLGHGVGVNQNDYTQTILKRRVEAVDTYETALKAS